MMGAVPSLDPVLAQAAELLATVTGQDLEEDAAGGPAFPWCAAGFA
jgi:hypothetical protein